MVLLVDVICDSYKDHFWPEIRLDSGITVGELKNKLYTKTGINPYSMKLFAFNPGNPENKLHLDDDNRNLTTYSVGKGFTIEVKESKNANIVDINENNGCVLKRNTNIDYSIVPNSNSKLYQHYVDHMDRFGEEIDETTFQRYEMSEEDYEKRDNGLRGFINRMRSKAESKSRVSDKQNESKPKLNDLSAIKSLYPVDSRCSVSPGDRRGTIVFVGHVDKSTVKIGVFLDEPLGDSDGSYNNKRYFDCTPNYAGFFDPTHVKVGDYPPLDILEMLE